MARLEQEQRDRNAAAVTARKLAGEAERGLGELELKQQRRDRCLADLAAIAASEKSQSERTNELKERLGAQKTAENELIVASQRRGELQRELQKTVRDGADLETALASVQKQAGRARDLTGHRRLAADHAKFAQFVGSILEQKALQKSLALKLAALPEITQAALDGLNAARARIETREKQLEAQALVVELIPERDTSVQITQAGEGRLQALKAGAPATLRAPQSLELELQGWGKMTVRSGAEEVRKIAESLSAEKTQLERELAQLRLKSAGEGSAILEERLELQKQIDAVAAAAAALLKSQKIAGDIEQELAKSQARLNDSQQRLELTPEEGARTSAELEADEQRLGVEEKDLGQRVKAQKLRESEARKMSESVEKQIATLKTHAAVLNEKLKPSRNKLLSRMHVTRKESDPPKPRRKACMWAPMRS